MKEILFYIEKFCSAWIMPPGLFILVLILFAIGGRKNHKFFAIPLYLCAVILYLLTSAGGVFFIVNPLEKGYLPSAAAVAAAPAAARAEAPAPAPSRSAAADRDADAIVILGGGSVGVGDSAVLTTDSAQRTLAGAVAARETNLPVITSGGFLNRNVKKSEAEVMADTLVSLGIPARRVTAESGSRTTGENAAEVASLCAGRGYGTIILVTSAMHMKRSAAAFERQGLVVIPRPAGFEGVYLPPVFLQYLPSGSALNSNLKALHEYVGILWYRFKYRERGSKATASEAASGS